MPKNKTVKREEAARRVEERAARSDKEQLAKLLHRGHGHCREAMRLDESIKRGHGRKS
jgi:hypothetical protein